MLPFLLVAVAWLIRVRSAEKPAETEGLQLNAYIRNYKRPTRNWQGFLVYSSMERLHGLLSDFHVFTPQPQPVQIHPVSQKTRSVLLPGHCAPFCQLMKTYSFRADHA